MTVKEAAARLRTSAATVRATQELAGMMSAFLASAQELLGHLPPDNHLRVTAEKIEQTARRGVSLASSLETSGRDPT